MLLRLTDAVAALLLAADLIVVVASVLLRSWFNAPVEWADDVARGLMVGSSFFGAASAIARAENPGVSFFVDLLPAGPRRIVDSAGALLVAVVSGYVAWTALALGWLTTGQTTGSGLPLELTFYPMGLGALCMTLFALDIFRRRPAAEIAGGVLVVALAAALYLAWDRLSPGTVPSPMMLMLLGFFVTLVGGLPIGFALALAALVFIWVEGNLPGVIFAQQMARGIDNFVLLAIPFFILVGYLMEANGMSVRLIALLQRLIGHMRGGLNVVMVMSMVLFSGISGSKMADVAAVGSVLIPAARKSGQRPGSAVALLAASAVMAETIPPCINLIILGFVANISIGGLFMAGLLPAGLMAVALIAVSIIFGKRPAARGRNRAADGGGQPVGRRHRLPGPDPDDLRRLQERLRHGHRDLRLRRPLRAGRGRRGVPRTGLAGGGAKLRARRDPFRPRAVHRLGGAGARLRAHPAAGAARRGRDAGQPLGLARHLALPAAVDRHPDRDGLGAGGRGGADHLRPAADAGGHAARRRSRCISASCWCSAWASACSRRRSASASTAPA